jgi:hypothetical protein
VKDLRVATPDGLRRSAFMEGFALRTRVSGTVDLKAVGRKLSGEGFASCDTGRLAPFRFYGSVRCANEGVRYGGLESGLGARSPARDLRVATPDGLRRSAFMEAFAVRTRVSGTVDLKAVWAQDLRRGICELRHRTACAVPLLWKGSLCERGCPVRWT